MAGLLYHEVQESKLCAVHCLNAVLQGPYFSELELASIARDLDKNERAVMLEGGSQSADYLRFVSEGSSNVSMDGNFSIQVLQSALGVLDLKCAPVGSDSSRSDPQKQQAFICHLHQHWFALRKVNGEWYNFNSLLAAPQHLSGFYMSAFLDSLKNEGWSMFAVEGELPREYSVADSSDGGRFGQWLTPEQAKEALEASNRQQLVDGTVAAGQESRSSSSEGQELTQEQVELAKAIAASFAGVRPPGAV